MSFLFCNQAQSPKSSEPTVPVILKGKKKGFRKSNDVGDKYQIQNTRITQRPQSIMFPRQRFSQPQAFSLPKTVSIYRPVPHPSEVEQRVSPQRIPFHMKEKKKDETGQIIRRNLDTNLNKIYTQLNRRRLSFDFQSKNFSQSLFVNPPRLQRSLVNEYIQLIYKDYSITDPLSQVNLNHGSIPSAFSNDTVPTQPRRSQLPNNRRDSILRGSTNRKAVQLKQSFLIQMFSPAAKNFSQQNQSFHSYESQQIKSPQKFSQKHHQPTSGYNMRQTVPIVQANEFAEKEISQNFRYCFICEQPILQANIEIHERESCPQFKNLYNMSLRQIKNSLIKKIIRIKEKTQQLYSALFQNQNESKIIQKLENLKKQTKKYLNNVNDNIKLNNSDIKLNVSQNSRFRTQSATKNGLKSNFNDVMQIYGQQYFKLYEYLRKLHWFNLMLKNLQTRYEQNEEIGRKHTKTNSSLWGRDIGDNIYKNIYL